MHVLDRIGFAALIACAAAPVQAQQITAAGQPAQLDIRAAGPHSIRVTLKPLSFTRDLPENPAVAERSYPAPVLSVRDVTRPAQARVSGMRVEVRGNPLTLIVDNERGERIQHIVFGADGTMSFALDDQPVLGMGEGGPTPAPGSPWREQAVQFDRRGAVDRMEPRWQSDMYGSRNPVAMLLGTRGWGIFVALPWVEVDMTSPGRGTFTPWFPPDSVPFQSQRNQHAQLGKGRHPHGATVPGLLDFFVFDARDPAHAMKDFSVITGPAAMPPKWALGYMQSHRTIESDSQLINIIDTFRAKRIPLDAVIYLGTGFTPSGWNSTQPSFEFNPAVFKRSGPDVLAEMEAKNVKTVVHMVPYDRPRLPTLQGSIPAKPGETIDASHIQNYWALHVPLVRAGVDAFWPDEGDWFSLWERIKRHQMYYQGMLAVKPNERPWHLQRNGYPGIAQWGGWVWSGDTNTAWKTLEAQIAVGLNYGLSVSPFWGSDIGGFYPNSEYTGELYARWFQFAAFCASFRSHGRTWWLRLPWGFGLSDMGPREHDNANRPLPQGDPRQILDSELNNPNIEPVAKKYAELRYQLMPYTYTLAWEARATGMPLMRALWLHYPNDTKARGTFKDYLWGRDMLIAPVYEKGATSRTVYLPAGDWYDWWTNQRTAGGRDVTRSVDLATMPIYVRAGAIIPFDPVRQYTMQPVTEPTTLRVYRGANGDFTLYEDDGISQQYMQGRGTWTRIRWNDAAGQLTLEPSAPAGATNVNPGSRTFRVMILPQGTTRNVTYNGARTQTTF